jgi:hypothetical protein
MTQDEAERIYDEEIAPALLDVAQKCEAHGFALVAHAEWWPGETGITNIVPDGSSAQMRMTQLAAHAHGNLDGFFIAIKKQFPEAGDQSMFMRKAMKKTV